MKDSHETLFIWELLVLQVFMVIGLVQFWGEHLFFQFPRIVSSGVTSPPYQVLKLVPSSKEAMPHDGLNLILLFAVHHFGWWVVIVDPMLFHFVIGGQQRGVKDVMDGPGRG